MSNENLQRWALVAEIVAGVAVVASLILVAYQLQQSTDQSALNTSALQIATYQDLTNNISDLNSLVVQDSELADIFIKATQSPDSLSANELMRFNTYVINLFRHGDMAYFQFERGAIDQNRLNSVLTILTSRLNNPIVKAQWISFKKNNVFPESYTRHVDELSANSKFGISDLFEKQSN